MQLYKSAHKMRDLIIIMTFFMKPFETMEHKRLKLTINIMQAQVTRKIYYALLAIGDGPISEIVILRSNYRSTNN